MRAMTAPPRLILIESAPFGAAEVAAAEEPVDVALAVARLDGLLMDGLAVRIVELAAKPDEAAPPVGYATMEEVPLPGTAVTVMFDAAATEETEDKTEEAEDKTEAAEDATDETEDTLDTETMTEDAELATEDALE